MKQPQFPEGWDEERVRRVLEHYEDQSDEQAVAEDEAAYEPHSHGDGHPGRTGATSSGTSRQGGDRLTLSQPK